MLGNLMKDRLEKIEVLFHRIGEVGIGLRKIFPQEKSRVLVACPHSTHIILSLRDDMKCLSQPIIYYLKSNCDDKYPTYFIV
jgi:hypothetical protein